MSAQLRRPSSAFVLAGAALSAVMAVTSAIPAFAQPQPFTLVTLPDTQNLHDSQFSLPVTGLPGALVNPAPAGEGLPANRNTLAQSQTWWVANNAASQNIQFVAHLGDIVQNATAPEFERTDGVFNRLDNAGLKYSTVPGNHDYSLTATTGGSGKYTTVNLPFQLANYNTRYGPNAVQPGTSNPRFSNKPWYLGSNNNGNSAQKFTAGGREWLHIGLEMNPHHVFNNQKAIDWAQGVLNSNPGVPTLITTHALIRDSTTPLGQNTGVNAGQDLAGVNLYRDLIRQNDQIVMTMNGHYHDLTNGNDGERFEVTTNKFGRPVYTLLSDFQDYPNGSDGYMRNYVFDEANNTIHAVTYSPRDGAINTAGAGASRFFQATPATPFAMPAGLPPVTEGTFQIDANSDFEIPFNFASRLGGIQPPQAAPKASFGPNGFSENFDSMGTGIDAGTGTINTLLGREAPLGFRTLTLPGNNDTFGTNFGPNEVRLLPASDPLSNFFYQGYLTVNSTYGGGTPSVANQNLGLNAAFASNISDRILATAPTGVAAAGIELQLTNDSGSSIDQLQISYEIARLSVASAVNELPGYHLFYSLDEGDTWINVGDLDPTVAGPSAVLVPNTIGVTSINDYLFPLSGTWLPGEALYLRWMDDNADQSSPDQIIGLNNLRIVVPEPSSLGLLAGLAALGLRRRGR